MTRRMQHYDVPEWRPWLIVAAVGAVLILCGIAFQIMQLVVSIRRPRATARRDRRSLGRPLAGMGDRLAAAGLQFRRIADVTGEDAYWDDEAARDEPAGSTQEPEYGPIEMPRNSPTGFVCAFFATVMGFALIWHIWWMVIAGASARSRLSSCSPGVTMMRIVIPAAEVARIDRSQPGAASRRCLARHCGRECCRMTHGCTDAQRPASWRRRPATCERPGVRSGSSSATASGSSCSATS